MNAGSLSLHKTRDMKASLVIKIFFVLPLILFVDYILALSVIFFGYLLYPDIKALFKSDKNGEAKQKQENL